MSFERRNEVAITVTRTFGQGYDMIEAFIPVQRKTNSGDEYVNVTANLRVTGWFPARDSFTPSGIGNLQGPTAYDATFQIRGGDSRLDEVAADVTLAKRMVAKYDKLLIKPKTFAECVAVWAEITDLPVDVLDAYTRFDCESLLGEREHRLPTPEAAKSFLEGVCWRITNKNLKNLGVDRNGDPIKKEEEKTEETTEVTQS